MKAKEIKNLAKKIAEAELKLRETTDLAEKGALEVEIVGLCSRAQSMEDMLAIDDAVQDILSKKL